MTEIKRGDPASLVLDTGVELAGYDSGRALLRHEFTGRLVEVELAIPTGDETQIEVPLTADDTEVAGPYLLELEFLPGPNTFPSEGYFRLRIREDLG